MPKTKPTIQREPSRFFSRELKVNKEQTTVQPSLRSYLKSAAETLAILAPIICLFDCVVLPVASALLPLFGHHLIHGIQDQLLALAVLCICGPIIVPGFAKHHNVSVLIMFALGSALMLFVNFVLVADELFHFGISIVASCLLIKANLDNKRLLACSCHLHIQPVKPVAHICDNHDHATETRS